MRVHTRICWVAMVLSGLLLSACSTTRVIDGGGDHCGDWTPGLERYSGKTARLHLRDGRVITGVLMSASVEGDLLLRTRQGSRRVTSAQVTRVELIERQQTLLIFSAAVLAAAAVTLAGQAIGAGFTGLGR